MFWPCTMETSDSGGNCTKCAFVGAVVTVVGVLYRKKQTRMDCNAAYWDQFWKYVSIENHGNINQIKDNIFMEGMDKLFTSNDQWQVDLDNDNPKRLQEISIFDRIYNVIPIHYPSDSVETYLSEMINEHLNDIRLNTLCDEGFEQCQDAFADQTYTAPSGRLGHYLHKHPLQILVPMCGCSYDLYYMAYVLRTKYKLNAKQFRIIGIERSLPAILNFFGTHELVHSHSCYNPRYMECGDFYRIEEYSSIEHSIHIIYADLFRYFDLCKLMKSIGIASTRGVIREKSVDMIVDMHGMACCDPSQQKRYVKALKYWIKDKGEILLDTHAYDPKLSNYPPYAIHPSNIEDVFKRNRCRLLETKQCKNERDAVRHSWLIKY
eukprot:36374_1